MDVSGYMKVWPLKKGCRWLEESGGDAKKRGMEKIILL
jgi:hypothetical protein